MTEKTYDYDWIIRVINFTATRPLTLPHQTRALVEAAQIVRERKEFDNDVELAVQERLDELNAEGEAFDTECWNVLRQLCEDTGLDWSDYPEGTTADDLFQHMTQVIGDMREGAR